MPLTNGSKFDPFEIVAPLGSGGGHSVYYWRVRIGPKGVPILGRKCNGSNHPALY